MAETLRQKPYGHNPKAETLWRTPKAETLRQKSYGRNPKAETLWPKP